MTLDSDDDDGGGGGGDMTTTRIIILHVFRVFMCKFSLDIHVVSITFFMIIVFCTSLV